MIDYRQVVAVGLVDQRLEAGLDVVDLRRQYGHRIGFCGNMSVITWANGSQEEIKAEALTKLNAAKGGGMIFQSDHSVPSNVSGENYDYVVKLVHEHGRYPLALGEYDVDMIPPAVQTAG